MTIAILSQHVLSSPLFQPGIHHGNTIASNGGWHLVEHPIFGKIAKEVGKIFKFYAV
jgi:hypothetical protein